MASAYAALVSLMNTITMETAPGRHPRHQISIDGEVIEALQERVNFLVEFLEGGWKVSEDLEGRIADAAHAAEHAIELYVADAFLARNKSPGESSTKHGRMSSVTDNTLVGMFQDLEKIIREMDMIKNEAIQIKVKCGLNDLHLESSTSPSPSSAPVSEKINMVGFEEDKVQIMEELTGCNSSRTIISIVGMGGAGKTTLARNIYDAEHIVQYFDVRAWTTISQEYNVKDIFIGILSAIRKQDVTHLQNLGDENLGELVHKECSGRRYLIVLDDVWSINVWDKIRRFFPDNCNDSRVMVTSRLSNVAKLLGSCSFGMRYLNEDESWNLLCKIVFAQNNYPLELVEVGKQIARNCKGLSLSIVVVGGLLAKFSKGVEHWKAVAQLSSSAVYLDDAQVCSKILSLSYNHLPAHLKPCFLYFGMFREDSEIHGCELINLWVAEGFLKPLSGKNMEEVAEEYLVDRIERNLVMINKRSVDMYNKFYVIHDLLRELCLMEAQKEKFYHVVTAPIVPLSMSFQRRIVVRLNKLESINDPHIIDFLLSAPHVHTLIVECVYILRMEDYDVLGSILRSPVFKLLRALHLIGYPDFKTATELTCMSKNFFDLVNLRYLRGYIGRMFNDMLDSCISLLRNLQILVVHDFNNELVAPSKILNLSQLREFEFLGNSILQPPFGEQEYDDSIILHNLHTLKGLTNFKFVKGVIKKIPNIKKMSISYNKKEEWPDYQFCNLRCLWKLESLDYMILTDAVMNQGEFFKNLAFLHSLKNLSIGYCSLLSADLSVMGSLPLLEGLRLSRCKFNELKWNPVVGEFLHLKYLTMFDGYYLELEHWDADSTHFPCLEELALYDFRKLKAIPLDIGEIATLRLITLDRCSHAVVMSAKRILEEQQSLGNDQLVVKVILYDSDQELWCLQISKNFLIKRIRLRGESAS